MYLYFVDDSNKAYYQSAAFGRLVTFLQQNPARVKIRENAATGRRSFAIATVPTVSSAAALLASVRALPAS